MKLKNALSTVLLTVVSLLGFSPRREEITNEASTVGTHANGICPFDTEEAIGTRYLAVKKGTAANGILINGAATKPWGVCLDEPASGVSASVALFGVTPGTLKVRASGAFAAGAKVWTDAGGKFTNTYASGAYYCGRSVTAPAADGDLFELAHCLPMLDASGTTL